MDFSPNSQDSEETKTSLKFINYLGAQCIIVKAGETYKSQFLLNPPESTSMETRFRYRFINNILLQVADNLSAILVNTASKSDRFLDERPQGFYGHLMPFYSFYSSEICDLAVRFKVPEEFILRAQNYQTWEKDNFGVSIQELDQVLHLLNEKQIAPVQIAQQFSIDPAWLEKLKKRIDAQSLINEVDEFII